jgi:hypothetical protein
MPYIPYPSFRCGIVLPNIIKYNFPFYIHYFLRGRANCSYGVGMKLANLFLYLDRIFHGSDLFLTFVASTLSHYGLLKLSPFSVRRWAEPNETFLFCTYAGRARLFGGLCFFPISTTSKRIHLSSIKLFHLASMSVLA